MVSEETLKKIKEMVKNTDVVFRDVEPIVSEEEINTKELSNIKKKIAKIKGISTEVKEEELKNAKKVSVITFKKIVTAEDGAKIPIIRRITLNEKEEIIKDTGN